MYSTQPSFLISREIVLGYEALQGSCVGNYQNNNILDTISWNTITRKYINISICVYMYTLGAAHGGELGFFFPSLYTSAGYTFAAAEAALGKSLRQAYANFMTTGNPSIQGTITIPTYCQGTTCTKGYVHLASSVTSDTGYDTAACAFWEGNNQQYMSQVNGVALINPATASAAAAGSGSGTITAAPGAGAASSHNANLAYVVLLSAAVVLVLSA
jgi:hypothetical protein